MVEVELLAAGLLTRCMDPMGRETLRVTDEGVAVMAQTLQGNRRVRDPHEVLVGQVALAMQRAGRIVWRGLSLRAPLSSDDAVQWAMAMPDVFSIRNTTVATYVEPIVHEIKVRRADLLGDVRQPHKREAYLALSSECWYVLKAGIGDASDVPDACGVMVSHDMGLVTARLEVLRAAPKRAMSLSFGTWMALAKATCVAPPDDAPQASF